jgi:thiamine biosynthesis lipoprotein
VAKHLLVESMAEFDRIEAGMSTYRPDSELSRINAAAADGWVDVSTELFDLIRRALELSQTTGGAFDITYDSVGTLYNYRERVRPAEQDIEAQLESIDYRHVQLDPDRSKIRYSRPGVRINLGGIAKGYSVESVIDRLRRAGITNALVSAGGDTRLLGDRGGQPWIVGVRDPDDENGFVTRLGLEDEAVSTSGDYERFFIEDGVRYHHILNPSTGKSAGAVRSATVIGGDATLTDGLSTSVFVLGPEAGLELIEGLPGYEALIIDKSHQVHFSSGLDPR